MIKLELTYEQQNTLLAALQQLDMHEIVGPDKAVRVPFKLGSERRTLVKNIRALQVSLSVWQDITKSIFKENFPGVPEGVSIDPKEKPVEWAKYISEVQISAKEKDEVELIPFSVKVIYEENEFPSMVVALLEERELVEDDPKASAGRLREVK